MLNETQIMLPDFKARSESNPEERPITLWGLDVLGIHDRCWSSFGVQVVRRGGDPVVKKGPQFYLLIEADDLVLFVLDPLVQQFNWLKPTAIRLRVTDSRGDGYNEIIEADESGHLVSVRRKYHKRTLRTIRAWLTPHSDVAESWRTATSRRSGWKQVSKSSDPDHVLAIGRPGRIFDHNSPRDVDDCLALIQHHWKDLGGTVDGLYEFEPGVWLHESVKVPPETRFIAPVWIGAGHDLGPDEMLIGPGGRPDSPSYELKATAIPWDEFLHTSWRLSGSRQKPRLRRVSKRLFDIAFSFLAILGTIPLYPFIMALILIEDGWPPFFAHRRQTLRGREFPCLKFRTMCKAAEGMKGDLEKDNVCDGPQFFIKEDPRLLKCGGFLRKYQLDELPQFWNVLVGHMSVVGPRPSPERENQYCPTWREARLSVRPGMTGLWQVRRTRRPQTDFQEWIRYDLEYVQHQNWQLDLWIIWQTIRRIFKG